MSIDKLIRLLLLVSVVMVLFLATWFFVIKKSPETNIDTSRAAIIKEIRELQRLETAVFTIDKIVEAGTTEKNVFSQFLFGDRILLIAHGQVIAGFDFSQLSEKDVEVNGKEIKLTLPKPQILVTTLDNTQTRVYDRRKGILNSGDKNLEADARLAAEQSITEAACKGGILQQAADNGRKQLTALLYALGFTSVTITIPPGDCR